MINRRMKRMRIRLVRNWRQSWRWFSVNCMTLAAAIQGGWVALPEDMKAGIPAPWVSMASVAVLVLGIIGRLIDQGGGEA